MRRHWWLVGLALALGVAILSPLASSHPDGLERVAEDKGFIGQAQSAWYEVIPDYVLPGVQNEALATVLAGLVGTGLIFALMYALGKVIVKRRFTT